MLTLVIFLPLAAALLLPAVPRRAVPWAWVAAGLADLALIAGMWAAHGTRGGTSYEADVRWIPSVRAGYHVGADGLSLPLLTLTALLFAACAVYSVRRERRTRAFAMLFLFLETVCLGVFAALDLLLFFVFFDLSIVGMYFVILVWGHGDGAARSALKFFLYTFLGSLFLLLGFIGLYLGSEPRTFDIAELTRDPPLEDAPALAGLTLLALGVGLGIKTPVVPFHTWLPPAHTDAPAPGSAILAGVMLKMGAYGLVRIAMPMLPGAWHRYAPAVLVVGLVSVLYGALVALAQDDVKRLVAYTSVNHMGYVVLALGAAGYADGTDGGAPASGPRLAVTGAVTQMVSHGLITGALFLLCGVLHARAGTHDLRRFGGVARAAPVFAGTFAAAAFASLGLPGFSGFVAEFQIFAGTIGTGAAATAAAGALAVLGIVVTAGLFLRVLHRLLLGGPGELTGRVGDLRRGEAAAIVPLLSLSLLIGLLPGPLLDTIEPLSAAVTGWVAR
ncbi:complex I subunit 4 family protein [Actinomadura rifamycini]|uniref:complex I subunit 4 family protein n=1 Tax=Actinomadura rifamycini TaxID=31962 RepID=UPI00040D8743|nr:NADH-quinone oxidoreductase subunit M [Actinomadura rifamycini]